MQIFLKPVFLIWSLVRLSGAKTIGTEFLFCFLERICGANTMGTEIVGNMEMILSVCQYLIYLGTAYIAVCQATHGHGQYYYNVKSPQSPMSKYNQSPFPRFSSKDYKTSHLQD